MGTCAREKQRVSCGKIAGRTFRACNAECVPHNAVGGCIMVALSRRLSHVSFDLLSPEVR